MWDTCPRDLFLYLILSPLIMVQGLVIFILRVYGHLLYMYTDIQTFNTHVTRVHTALNTRTLTQFS